MPNTTCAHRSWVKESFATILCLRLEVLCKRLMVKFKDKDALDYGGSLQ